MPLPVPPPYRKCAGRLGGASGGWTTNSGGGVVTNKSPMSSRIRPNRRSKPQPQCNAPGLLEPFRQRLSCPSPPPSLPSSLLLCLSPRFSSLPCLFLSVPPPVLRPSPRMARLAQEPERLPRRPPAPFEALFLRPARPQIVRPPLGQVRAGSAGAHGRPRGTEGGWHGGGTRQGERTPRCGD